MLIDICTTGTLRPEILHTTYSSFFTRMLKPVADQCRAIINIDPVGSLDINKMIEIDAIVREFFPVRITNMPERPSFPKAFVWTWKHASAPYVLNLEEDWELLMDVDVMDMIDILETEPDLALLRLPYRPCSDTTNKNWSTFYPLSKNGRYFECPEQRRADLGFAGHPSLIRGEFVRRALQYLSEDANPEKQFHGRGSPIIPMILEYRYGVYGKPNTPAYIRDIGRRWMVEQGWVKKGPKPIFTEWEKVQ